MAKRSLAPDVEGSRSRERTRRAGSHPPRHATPIGDGASPGPGAFGGRAGDPGPGDALLPEWLERDGALLVGLPALLPAFLLTYHRGWQGASLALAAGMAVLALTQIEIASLTWRHRSGVRYSRWS